MDLLAQDRYSEGKEYFEKALDYIHKYNLGDWEEKFVKMNLAQAYLEMNEFHELKKILPEVETFFKEVDYKTALHFVKTLQIEMENHQVVTHLSLEEAKHLISTDLEDIDVPELQNERLKALLGRYAIANDGKRFYATYRVLDSLTSKQNDMNLRMRLSAFVATSELTISHMSVSITIATCGRLNVLTELSMFYVTEQMPIRYCHTLRCSYR